jgi:hypothetical protein
MQELQESEAFKEFHEAVAEALMEFVSDIGDHAPTEMRAQCILYSLLGTVLGFYFNASGLRPSDEDLRMHVEIALNTYKQHIRAGIVPPLRVIPGGGGN